MGCFSWIRWPIQIVLLLSILLLAAFACVSENPSTAAPGTPISTSEGSELGSCDFPEADLTVPGEQRAFALGFSRWPPAANQAAIDRLDQFIDRHADMTLIHLDSGVPWPEALAADSFSNHIQNDWRSNLEAVPADHLLFVAITPLNMDRDGLAAYRGDQDNQNLPAEWKGRPLNDPEVIDAYTNYAHRAIEFFNPDYFAIGIEVNLTLNAKPGLWQQYLELHQHVYQSLKQEYPSLSIFATFTYPDMKGDRDDSAPAEEHQQAVGQLANYSDLLGLSVYPYSYIYDGDGTLPADYFDLALSYGLPIAITESGMPSQAFTSFLVDYPFEIQHQTNYMQSLLRHANRNGFEFVINWAAIDFEELLQEIPFFLRDLARFWAYTGLETAQGCDKPALELWDAYLALERK